MKTGFVNIFGKPNAGKSTLLNALMGEKMAIVSPKVQTTRHRIKTILTGDDYQIIFSDTPGIIEPKYKLHQKMMQAVKGTLEDADVGLLIADAGQDVKETDEIFASLKLKAPCIVVLNKSDLVDEKNLEEKKKFFQQQPYCREVLAISALRKAGINNLLERILFYLPEGEPFYDNDDLSDMPTKFFVSEIIREKVFHLFHEELPYHTAVVVQEFKEKQTLIKIRADIVVQRETQKGIILGDKGSMIKQLGTLSRKELEEFLGQKVFLELFVKVRPKWRDSETHLKEYGY